MRFVHAYNEWDYSQYNIQSTLANSSDISKKEGVPAFKAYILHAITNAITNVVEFDSSRYSPRV